MDNSVYYNQELNIYVKVDAIKSMTSSEDGDAWVFEGIASTADMDLYNEVVYPESFLNSIEFFKNNGKIFFDHDYAKANADWLSNHGFSKDEILALRTPIGKPLDAKITDEGLHIRAMLNKEHPMARLMWNQYLNNKDSAFQDQLGLSIGAKYLGQPRKEYDVKKGKYVTYLPDLLLYEVSLTPEPVNPHTKSWKAAIKSLLDTAEVEDSNRVEFHRIVPDEIRFDDSTNQITVKSTVVDSDGVSHVFEQVIDVKEDMIKSMENEKDIQAMESVVEAVSASEEIDVQKASEVTMKQVPQQGGPVVPQQPGDQGTPPAPEQQGAPMEGAPEAPMMEGAEGGEGDDGSSSVLEALAEQSDSSASEEGAPEDDAMSLVLDKLDALTDIVSQLMDRMESSESTEEAPAESQVTTDVPPMKSMSEDTMKSIVAEAVSSAVETVFAGFQSEDTQKSLEISQESASMLADTIKSAIVSVEESLLERVVERVLTETSVGGSTQKSVSDVASEAPVVHPGAIADGVEANDVDVEVMKSVSSASEGEMSPEKMDTLKSLVGEYNSIRGYTTDKSQQRARVIEQAQKELGIHPSIFNVYANKAQKGKF